jgi:glycosyltransferase involved in cell wall biosynthesis
VISVIIPVRNGGSQFAQQLEALRAASSGEWELIIADNGSTDGTVELAESFADSLPLRVIDASNRSGPAAVRNFAVKDARGDFLVFTDADDVVASTWLSAWQRAACCIEFGTGPLVWIGPEEVPAEVSRDDDDFRPPRHMRFLSYALGANFGLRRDVFDRFGGFDERYVTASAEDVELSWRLQLAGIDCTPVRSALIAKRRRERTFDVIRQYIRYGKSDPLLFADFRSQGLAREPFTATLRSYIGLLVRVPLLFRESTRFAWASQLGRRIGRIIGSVQARVFLP